MTRIFLLLAGAVILAAVLILLVTGPGPGADTSAHAPLAPRSAATRELDTEPDVPPALELTLPAASEGERTMQQPTPEPEAVSVDPIPVEVPHASASTIAVEGRILVVDEEGMEHAAEDGAFVPVLWQGSSGQHGDEVAIQEGAFQLEVPEARRLGFTSVRLGGRDAILEQEEPLTVRPGEPLELRARWPRAVQVRVLDRESHRPLSPVTVVGRWDTGYPRDDDPGDYPASAVLVDGAPSPVSLEREDLGEVWNPTRVPVWVGVRGYTWKRVELNLALGGEQLVLLDPACVLEVTLFGRPAAWSDLGEPTVRVREVLDAERFDLPDLDEVMEQIAEAPLEAFPEGRRPTREEIEEQFAELFERQADERPQGMVLAERPAGRADPIRFDGLAPGRRQVTVELGDPWEDARILLGLGEVTLATDAIATLAIELDELPASPDAVPLAGTLFVPDGWELDSFFLRLEPEDLPGADWNDWIRIPSPSMQVVEGTATEYRWEAEGAFPGRYKIVVGDHAFPEFLEVPPGGRGDVRLRIAEPADVTVELVEAGTGAPAEIDTLHYYPERPPGVQGGALENAERSADGLYRLRVPAGAVGIYLSASAYGHYDQKHAVRAGENHLRIELRRNCGVRLRFLDGQRTVVPESSVTDIGVDGGAGAGRPVSWTTRGGEMSIHLSSPGSYELTFPTIEGYRPVPPRTVVVPEGTIVPVDVALERAF